LGAEPFYLLCAENQQTTMTLRSSLIEWFTGTVGIDPLFQAPDPARVRGASITFEPDARTAWHTHPFGQTLLVMAGCGWVQRQGRPIKEIRPRDVVWFSPGEKHWHGATSTTAMTHIAIQEKQKGKVVDRLEQVTEQQYRRQFGDHPKNRGANNASRYRAPFARGNPNSKGSDSPNRSLKT
jgi:quercetin dioxygenase-like cupin family protein